MDRLIVDVAAKDGFDQLVLRGTIDEHTRLVDNEWSIGQPTLVLLLRDLARINSAGVREWVAWMSTLQERRVQVVLCECSPVVVSQLNLTANFAPRARIESFVLPCFCQPCSVERLLLVHHDDVAADARLPGATCEVCGADLLTDPADVRFLLRTAPVALDPRVQRALAQMRAQTPHGGARARA